jgi:RNA polymerase sigma factor (TIGR02999 family)
MMHAGSKSTEDGRSGMEHTEKEKRSSLDALVPSVYRELRRMSAVFLYWERQGHTLQPTALVNEVYLLLAAQRSVDWKDPGQLIGLASQMMRRILVNYAEVRKVEKRGPAEKLPLDEVVHASKEPDADILALHDALTSLAEIDPEKSRIIELRFFTGLTMEEIACIAGKSLATVEREWYMARAWLYREICRK